MVKINLLFIHIPKTGGMTIETILRENNYRNGIPRKVLREFRSYELLSNKFSYLQKNSRYHFPLAVYKKKYQEKFKREKILFTIVRNPYHRIISDFRFWVSEFAPNHKNSENNHMRELVLEIESIVPDMSINKENLNKFIHYVLDDKNYSFSLLDGHLIPMYKYTHSRNLSRLQSHCTILRFESLTKDFNNLIKKLNLDIPLDLTDSIYKNVCRGPKLFIDDLDSLSIKLIQEKYSLDFKLFDYPL